MWALGRNKNVFGDDVDRFRPERWLEATRDELREFQRADLTFGAGLTTCLGKSVLNSQLVVQLEDFELESYLTTSHHRHIASFEIHKTLAEVRVPHVFVTLPIKSEFSDCTLTISDDK